MDFYKGMALIEEAPDKVQGTRGIAIAATPKGRRVIYVHSLSAFRLAAIAKVLWHDDPDHCPNWQTECRCDIDPTI